MVKMLWNLTIHLILNSVNIGGCSRTYSIEAVGCGERWRTEGRHQTQDRDKEVRWGWEEEQGNQGKRTSLVKGGL